MMIIIMIIPNRSRVYFSSAPNCSSVDPFPGAKAVTVLLPNITNNRSKAPKISIHPHKIHQNTLTSKKHTKKIDMI